MKGMTVAQNLAYDLEAIRSKMRQKKGGKGRDPNEWRPDKAEANKPLKWKFFILPPTDNMDLWYYEHGAHFIENKVIECPRIHDETTCPLCQFGFDQMKDVKDKAERSQIAKNYLSSSRYAVNIYFPAIDSTPADLRGKVMWFSMPQSVFQLCEDVIMRDSAGDSMESEEAAPYGIFYDPNNAMPFVLEAKKKGDFNSYEASHFIGKKMPITKGGDEKIAEILGMRHDLPSLFTARNVDALQSIVDNLEGNSRPSEPKPSKPAGKSDADDLEELVSEEKKPAKAPAKPEPTKKPEPSKDPKKTETKKQEPVEEAEVEEKDEDLASLLEELNNG
jgi:hypothetical protein